MKLPWSAEVRLRPDDWESVRMRLMFDCCKWDIQSEDHSVVADFPLILGQEEWNSLAGHAEKLTEEVLAAEGELLGRPDLHKMLGLPERHLPCSSKVCARENRNRRSEGHAI